MEIYIILNEKLSLETINNEISNCFELCKKNGFVLVEKENNSKIFNLMKGRFIKYYLVKDSIDSYTLEIFYNDDFNYLSIYTTPLYLE